MYDPVPAHGPQRVQQVYARRNFEDCAVLGESEIKRLIQLTKGGRQQQDEIDKHKGAMKQLSNDRISTWSNTIENRRIESNRTRMVRMAKDEQRRLIIDQEEADLASVSRKQTMESAERKLFETNDKVKTFHSHLQTYNTMIERDEQLKMSAQLKENRAKRELALGEQEARSVERKAQDDLVRLRESKVKGLEAKNVQLKQIHDERAYRKSQLNDGKEEREALLRAAQDAMHEEQEKVARQRDVAKAIQRDVKEQLKEKVALRTQLKEEAHRSASALDRNSFVSIKGERQHHLDERRNNRMAAKLGKIQIEYEHLDKLRQEKEDVIVALEARRQHEGVLGVGDRMTEDDHSRTTERKAYRNSGNLHGDNNRRAENRQRDFLLEQRRMKAIRANTEAALEEEIEEVNARKREDRRVQQILLLQKKEKEAQKIQQRLSDIEEKREQDYATEQMNEEAKRYIDHSLAALPPVAQKYQMQQKSPGSRPPSDFDLLRGYSSDGSPQRQTPEKLIHPTEAARQQLLKLSSKTHRHQA